MSDLILPRPEEPKLIPVIKDAEACAVCGGSRPDLFWNGYYLLHIQCAKDAKAARRIEKPERGISVDEFMKRLEARPELLRRLSNARH